jgi:uncharacterized protein DUF2567
VPEASEEPTAESVWAVGTAYSPSWSYPPPPPPRVTIKPDLVPSAIVLVATVLLGFLVGWVWSLLAPPQRMRVLADRPVPLPIESYHRFDDVVLFVLLSLGAGLITGFAVWLLRRWRGPVIMIAAVLGGVGAAVVARQVGLTLAEARWAVPANPEVGDVVSAAPTLETWWILLAWPLTTALAYGILAAWNGSDDLDRPTS